MKSIIVAYDKNRGIGAANDLLWQRDLPADLARFKELTTGHPIIMGRKTFESIGHALPNRRNIVVSHNALDVEGIETVGGLNEAYSLAGDEDVFVIGGGQIYAQALPTVDHVYATEVDASFAAEIFFPTLPENEWTEITREHHTRDEHNKYNYDFVTYTRV
jgi:dihydrofolate reductase